MASIVIPKGHPRPLYAARRARNTLVPDFRTPKEIADRANWVLAHARKVFFQRTLALDTHTTVSSTTWRWLCRTGEASGTLKMVAIATAVGPCSFTFTADDGVSPITSSTILYSATAEDTYDDVHLMVGEIEVDPDTEYECYLSPDPSLTHPMSICVLEVADDSVDTTDTITTDPRGFFNRAPIYDGPHQGLVQNVHDLWRHNGAQLLALARDPDPSDRWTRSSATFANMLDDGSTTVDSDSAGFNFHTEFLNPYHTTDITAVFGVHASNDSAAGGTVRLQDADGTINSVSSFSTSGEWLKTTVTLTGGADHKVDIQFAGNGSNFLRVNAVSIYLYES